MKPLKIKQHINFSLPTALFCLVVIFNSCRVEKNSYQILKLSTKDSTILRPKFGSVKDLGIKLNINKNALLFDSYIANDFNLPKRKRDSAAIVNYFRKTAFSQLGRKEFRQWDLVVVGGVLFQINVEKKPEAELPLFLHQQLMEIIGMILLMLAFLI